MEKQLSEKIIEFFGREITDEEFARTTRRFVVETIRMVFESNHEHFNKEWLSDGYYWLNEFCEILDPQLEKEIGYGIDHNGITQNKN